jgi:hypothetical protein
LGPLTLSSFVDGWKMGECKGINLFFVSLVVSLFSSIVLKNSLDYFMRGKNARGAHHSTYKA